MSWGLTLCQWKLHQQQRKPVFFLGNSGRRWEMSGTKQQFRKNVKEQQAEEEDGVGVRGVDPTSAGYTGQSLQLTPVWTDKSMHFLLRVRPPAELATRLICFVRWCECSTAQWTTTEMQHCSRGLNCSAQESVITYMGMTWISWPFIISISNHEIRGLLVCGEEKWMSENFL